MKRFDRARRRSERRVGRAETQEDNSSCANRKWPSQWRVGRSCVDGASVEWHRWFRAGPIATSRPLHLLHVSHQLVPSTCGRSTFAALRTFRAARTRVEDDALGATAAARLSRKWDTWSFSNCVRLCSNVRTLSSHSSDAMAIESKNHAPVGRSTHAAACVCRGGAWGFYQRTKRKDPRIPLREKCLFASRAGAFTPLCWIDLPRVVTRDGRGRGPSGTGRFHPSRGFPTTVFASGTDVVLSWCPTPEHRCRTHIRFAHTRVTFDGCRRGSSSFVTTPPGISWTDHTQDVLQEHEASKPQLLDRHGQHAHAGAAGAPPGDCTLHHRLAGTTCQRISFALCQTFASSSRCVRGRGCR